MQSNQEKKFTPLLPLIKTYLSSTKKRSQLNQYVSNKELVLGVIEKGAVMCVTDMRHSIQSTKTKVKLDKIHPFSRQISDFYNVANRSWISFNASRQDLGQPSQYPHPYQPCFYFKKDYADYRKERSTIKLDLVCEVIHVKRWAFRILNISESGYYGIVLELLDFRYTEEKSIQNVVEVSTVLYDPFVKAKLQAIRLDDMRMMYRNVDIKRPWSMFYDCKFVNCNLGKKKKLKLTNMVIVDKNQEILTFEQERKLHFVSFGYIMGVKNVQFPLNAQQIDYAKFKKINTQQMQCLFSKINQPNKIPAFKDRYRQGQLWSSDEESSDPAAQQNQQYDVKINSESESDDDDDIRPGQDPLKNLYIKQFQNLKIL